MSSSRGLPQRFAEARSSVIRLQSGRPHLSISCRTLETDMTKAAPMTQQVDQYAVRERASHPNSTQPRPFLRWAGSKKKLLVQLVELLPENYVRYVEPFAGGGSLFFALRPRVALLADSCLELVDTYTAVRDGPDHVLDCLSDWVPDKAFFYELRGNRSSERYRRAAEFIYLNKTCWNGLYRVNADGIFNVPYGAPKSSNLVDSSNLRACSRLLAMPGVEIRCADFRDTLAESGAGDLVFLDPPYVTQHNNNGFIDYNENLFSWEDQISAADAARAAVARGATVIATNAYHRDVLQLYPDFNTRVLTRKSTLASNAARRATTQEAVFWKSPADAD